MSDEKESVSFSKRLQQKEKEEKKKKLDASHPYTYVKYFLTLYLAVPMILVFLILILVEQQLWQYLGTVSQVATAFAWAFTLPLQILGTLFDLTGYVLSEPIFKIPLETIVFYKPFFDSSPILVVDFSINYFNFHNSIMYALNGFIDELLYQKGDSFEETTASVLFFALLYIQSFLFFRVWIYFIEKRIVNKRNSLDILKDLEKCYKDPDLESKTKKLKNEYVSIQKSDNIIRRTEMYKKLFEIRDFVTIARVVNSFYEYKIKKYDFTTQINKVFEENIPNKYYNIINFLDSTDLKLFNLEKETNEDTFKQKTWTKKNLKNYLNAFDETNIHFSLPIIIARLKTYRNLDTHNIFDEGLKKHPQEFGLEDLNDEQKSKLKRIAKEGYKIFDSNSTNYDRIKMSIQNRYPFSFSFDTIDKLEDIREKSKELSINLVLKYLGNDVNMKVWDLELDEVNDQVFEYFVEDCFSIIENALEFHKVYFEELKKTPKYSWLNIETGKQLDLFMVSLIHMNFNPLLFLETLASVNSTHFKGIFFLDEELDNESLSGVVEDLKNNNTITDFVNEHKFNEKFKCFQKNNMGYTRMLDLAQELTGTIDDTNKIKPFYEEFTNTYFNIGRKL